MACLAGLASLNYVLIEVYTAMPVWATLAGDMDRLGALEHYLYRANPVRGAGEEAEGVERGERRGSKKNHRLVTGNPRFSAEDFGSKRPQLLQCSPG